MELTSLLERMKMEHLLAQLDGVCEHAAKGDLDYKGFLTQALRAAMPRSVSPMHREAARCIRSHRFVYRTSGAIVFERATLKTKNDSDVLSTPRASKRSAICPRRPLACA